MYKVNVYMQVRRACLVEGKSVRGAAREFGLNRRTIQKMVENALPPGYCRKQRPCKPKLEPHFEFIDQILSDDKRCPKKQRHTARRIFARLREERGYKGGYTIVREYVAKQRVRSKEMFCPLVHRAGEAQVDFGEALVIIGGIKQKAHLFCDGFASK